MFVCLLIFLCLTGNYCKNPGNPYLLNLHESCYFGIWYPAVSLTSPNHYCTHQFFQAAFVSDINFISTRRIDKSPFCQGNKKLRLKLVLIYLCIILIAQSHDVETNPGPRTPRYPCGVCGKAVRWSRTRKAVACDTCDVWFHCDCMGMSSLSYNRINRSDVTWICSSCDTPNYSSSLLESYVTNRPTNMFHHLSELDSTLDHELLTGSPNPSPARSAAGASEIDAPISHSSPINPSVKRRKISPRPLKVLSVNLQSLNAKKEAFFEAVDSCQPDVIAANETWLKPSILNSEIIPPGFNPPIRKDRPNDAHGGVLLATKNDIIDSEVSVEDGCELVATKIQLYSQSPLIIISAYRPPNNDISYTHKMCQIIRNIVTSNPSAVIWLTGDFNLPDIDWASMSTLSHQYSSVINDCFISTFNDLGLIQMVNFPTREKNTLDLFATNRPSLVTKCIPLPGVSDHEMVLALSDIRANRRKPIKRKILLWSRADMSSIRSGIEHFSHRFIHSNSINSDVNDLWSQITKELNSLIDAMVPSKQTSTRFSQPWINSKLKSLSRKKKKAFHRARKTASSSDWSHYKTLKKIMQKECRNAYHNFINNMFCDGQDTLKHPKKFWSYIKSRRCENTGVAPLLSNGILQSDSSTKANLLNDQFVSVFTNEDTSDLPNLGPSLHPEVPTFSIDSEGIRKLFSKMNPHTAAGPDGLPAYLLKEAAEELAPVFSLLFNATIHQGKIPHEWKTAHVTPLFKKGNKHHPVNYRPISLTSLVCKAAEHIIHSQIIKHLDAHNLLTECQFGFRAMRSCESQLLLTIDDLARGLRDKQQIDCIFLDFSKAFDKVPHERLLLKLHHYGVRGRLLSWIRDFLSQRTQQVILEGNKSNISSVTSGVPQGTVLGPLLFLIFINDMPDFVSSNIRLFADDALLYRCIQTPDDITILEEDIENLQVWERRWLMSFNADKCEVLRVSNKRNNIIGSSPYSIHGTPLRTVDEAKYLGVTIHKNLSWKPHVHNICNKGNSTLGFIRRNLRKCPKNIKEQAYNTYVRPTLEYSSTVWDPHTKGLISQIDMIQRRAARFVLSNYNQRDSVTLMLKDLGWRTLYERRAQSKVIMLYKIVHGLVAVPASQPYLFKSSDHTRGHHLKFMQQHCRIRVFESSFFPSVVSLWNALPSSTLSATTTEAFRRHVAELTLR